MTALEDQLEELMASEECRSSSFSISSCRRLIL
jgi:hypothetical protein